MTRGFGGHGSGARLGEIGSQAGWEGWREGSEKETSECSDVEPQLSEVDEMAGVEPGLAVEL